MACTRKTARLTTKATKTKAMSKSKTVTGKGKATIPAKDDVRPARSFLITDREWTGMGDVIQFVRDNEWRFLEMTRGETAENPTVLD